MILYDNFYENNILKKHNAVMEEYEKYNKLFIQVNSKCPIDIKLLLDKEDHGKEFILKCKLKNGKEWKATIHRPTIVNLFEEKTRVGKDYKNLIQTLKEILKTSMKLPFYKPEDDDTIKKITREIKEFEQTLKSIKNIFDMELKENNELIKSKQEYLKKLAEINHNKQKLYKKLVIISQENKNKLKEILLNEGIPSTQRINQIAKNVNLNGENTQNWIQWLGYVKEYVENIKELEQINYTLIERNREFRKINEEFIVEEPQINIKSDSKKEVVLEVNEPKKRKVKLAKKKSIAK